jgi:hypothetical protein
VRFWSELFADGENRSVASTASLNFPRVLMGTPSDTSGCSGSLSRHRCSSLSWCFASGILVHAWGVMAGRKRSCRREARVSTRRRGLPNCDKAVVVDGGATKTGTMEHLATPSFQVRDRTGRGARN